MLFNSYTFVVFFAVVLALYWTLRPWRIRKALLLVSSYVFYAAWNPPFVLLLAFSTVADWYLARALHAASHSGARRLLLTGSLLVNLGLLGFFKYGDFVLENLRLARYVLDAPLSLPVLDIVLPVGISFYTFQTLSYTMDIYRGRLAPWSSFLDYALYVSFFPQLVAGPIVRARDFLPQTTTRHLFNAERLGWGLSLLLLGLFEKVVIADAIFAPVADSVFQKTSVPSMVDSWVGTLAFAGQIFSDFAGYSTCAVGVALAMGFHLPTNFRYPYAAVGFSDFWRRWHITLSTWLRDYLYIPLGGNRASATRTKVNLLVTMLLGGLWHGASWTFVIWGALHGTYLLIERALRERLAPPRGAMRLGAGALTFLLTCIAWVFFRASDVTMAVGMVGAMLGLGTSGAMSAVDKVQAALAMATMAALVATHAAMRERSLEEVVGKAPRWALACTLALMILGLLVFPSEDRAFIYFQF